MRLAVLLVLVAPALGAQVPVVPSDSALAFAHRIAGCYRLDDGPWRADSVRAGDVSTEGTPLWFELTDRLIRGWEPLQSSDRPLFVVLDSTGEVHSSFEYWQRDGTDSVFLSNPLAFAGVDLTLTPAGTDLSGVVSAFTDAIEKDKPSAVFRPVRARRVRCPAR